MMRKIIPVLILLFSTMLMNAQTFGASGLDVKRTFSQTKPIYKQWLRLGNTTNVTIKFEQTPQGLKDALSLVQRMLVENELYMNRPDIYKSLRAEKVEEEDSAVLHGAIQDQEAKVNLAWFSPDGSTLHLFLGKYSYEVNVINAFKS